MIDSLKRLKCDFTIWVLCLTDECEKILEKLSIPELKLHTLSQIEKDERKLCKIKKNRKLSEYYFTLSPYLPSWILYRNPELHSITYLDADMEFFSSPERILHQCFRYSIGIIEHRFHKTYDVRHLYGRFNVGWIYFKNNRETRKCLDQWKKQCNEYCGDKPKDGKFADQKYLDTWPADFENVKIISHPGTNVAPWNRNTHKITREHGDLKSDKRKLIFFHFQDIRKLEQKIFNPNFSAYNINTDKKDFVIKYLYKPYLKKVLEKEKLISKIGFKSDAFNTNRTFKTKHLEPNDLIVLSD